MTHLYPKSNKGTLFSFNFPRRAKHQLSSERGHFKIQPTDTGLPHGALPGRVSAMACDKKTYNPGQKSLGQYCNIHIFSVISWCPLKTVHPFQNFLAVLPPPTLYKVETRKKLWIHASKIVCGVRGGLRLVWIEKRPRKCKSVPRLLSVIVDKRYRAFSHDVTKVILVFQNNETAAMLVSQTMKWLPWFGIPNKSCGS